MTDAVFSWVLIGMLASFAFGAFTGMAIKFGDRKD